MTASSDDALRALMKKDVAAGWRAFIDHYSPLIVGAIRRAGLVDRDEVMEVYVGMCEQLSARDCERIRSQDAARGSIGGWLTVVARHAVVDWVRSKKGRRRLFQAVQELAPFDQRVFELYYWDERMPSEIAEVLATEMRACPDLPRVFDALERVQNTLNARHRAELFALALRSRAPAALDDAGVADRVEDPQSSPETAMRAKQLQARLEAAVRRLPSEDAAIVRLKYVEGLTNASIERALGISSISARRVEDILSRLRAALADVGVDRHDVTLAPHLAFRGDAP